MSDPEKTEQDEPKLVVDTDWKEQVAKEKEAAAINEAVANGESSDDMTVEDQPTDDTAGSPAEFPAPPPASFEVLISMLFTQALGALGQIPDPSGGEPTINKSYAKHYIDTLEMLGEKTEGNLSEDESTMLSEALHALRMAYVNVKG